ncbi:MAG: FimV/HubP family polar landmark protein [Steroidobacteraceae bacterium]
MIAKRSSLVMALLLALPQAALALGLGTIHVKSHLDQPLDARIDLLDATPGAVQSLSVGLASQATFAKYGLNWPSYLNGVQVKVVPGPGASVQLHVTSPLPVTDPILTLVVKASWDRGVLFREYTILVNPPVYVPGSSQPHHVAVAAPVVGNAPRTGELPGASAPAVSAPVAAAAALPASPSGGPSTVHVHAGQTLSGIASRVSGGGMNSGRTRQWMVAIYQRNPQAFANNMNLLRAGAVLHIPSASAAAQVSPSAAWQQVLSQDNAWRAAQGQGSSGSSGHLRLVAPQAPGVGTSAGASAATGTSAQVSALRTQVQTLQNELAQEKRLVQVKSAALAALQGQAAAGAAAAHVGPAPAPAAAKSAHPHTVQAHRPASAAVTHPAAPGELGQMLRRYWWALLALLVLIGAYIAAKVLRSRGESAADERLIESAEPTFAPPAARAMPMSPSGVPSHADEAIDVREATHEQPRLEMNEAASPRVAPHVPADQTMSSETALNLEQGDPLAEADFHMAYGLYDQAADLIRIAIQREPERRDLKLKLLEVFFVWGNKDQFVEMAHELEETREQAPAGEWEKVVIMGRQLAPDDPLFASSELSGAASQGVDLDLEGGQGRVDFDLMDGAGHAAGSGGTASTGSFDLDIGAALGEETHGADTVANTLSHTLPGGDTEETPRWPGAGAETGVTQELPGRGLDAASAFEPVEPTVEQPALHQAGHAALREKVEALSQGSDRTAELAIDDLGLDLGGFETSVQPALGGDSPTLVAGLDVASREALERTGEAGEHAPKPAAPSSTGTTSAWQIDERELENLLSEEHGGSAQDTSMTSRLNALEAGGVDFDLGGAEPQAKPQNGNGLDFDIGAATFAHASLVVPHESPTEENSLAEFEPVTLSEVGTKLDLARAYMDMGDPEGARSILEEVMHEGSDAQRQEAGRLLESLPG